MTELFDMVSGSGSGAIIATSLVIPDEDGKFKHYAASAYNWYYFYIPMLWESYYYHWGWYTLIIACATPVIYCLMNRATESCFGTDGKDKA